MIDDDDTEGQFTSRPPALKQRPATIEHEELKFSCVIPSSAFLRRGDIVVVVDQGLAISVRDAVTAEEIAQGRFVPTGFNWRAGARWSSTGRAMVEEYLLGLSRVFRSGHIPCAAWRPDARGMRLLSLHPIQ